MAKPVNTTPPRLFLYEILKFWSEVNREPGQGPLGNCWEWKRLRDSDNYGHATIDGRHIKTHRYAFFLANEYWPYEHVLNTCLKVRKRKTIETKSPKVVNLTGQATG